MFTKDEKAELARLARLARFGGVKDRKRYNEYKRDLEKKAELLKEAAKAKKRDITLPVGKTYKPRVSTSIMEINHWRTENNKVFQPGDNQQVVDNMNDFLDQKGFNINIDYKNSKFYPFTYHGDEKIRLYPPDTMKIQCLIYNFPLDWKPKFIGNELLQHILIKYMSLTRRDFYSWVNKQDWKKLKFFIKPSFNDMSFVNKELLKKELNIPEINFVTEDGKERIKIVLDKGIIPIYDDIWDDFLLTHFKWAGNMIPKELLKRLQNLREGPLKQGLKNLKEEKDQKYKKVMQRQILWQLKKLEKEPGQISYEVYKKVGDCTKYKPGFPKQRALQNPKLVVELVKAYKEREENDAKKAFREIEIAHIYDEILSRLSQLFFKDLSHWIIHILCKMNKRIVQPFPIPKKIISSEYGPKPFEVPVILPVPSSLAQQIWNKPNIRNKIPSTEGGVENGYYEEIDILPRFKTIRSCWCYHIKPNENLFDKLGFRPFEPGKSTGQYQVTTKKQLKKRLNEDRLKKKKEKKAIAKKKAKANGTPWVTKKLMDDNIILKF